MINYQKQLPFFNVTNPELNNLLESIHKSIKTLLEDTGFNNHILASLPQSSIIKKGCKFYEIEDVKKIITPKSNEEILFMEADLDWLMQI